MIAGIVLAAGQSRRMGRPKAFLALGGRTFLERVVAALREGGCGEIIVVAGAPEDETGRRTAEAAQALGARVVVNPSADSEQVDSLRIGLGAVSVEADAALVCPVDVPGVTAEMVAAVLAAFTRSGAPVALPAREGKHGHPVLFARRVWPELLDGELPEGARTVVHRHADELAEVPVDDLPEDVDTPADHARLLESAE